VLAGMLALYAAMSVLMQRLSESALEDSRRAVASARKQIAEYNALLAAMKEAIDTNDVTPLRRYWGARNR